MHRKDKDVKTEDVNIGRGLFGVGLGAFDSGCFDSDDKNIQTVYHKANKKCNSDYLSVSLPLSVSQSRPLTVLNVCGYVLVFETEIERQMSDPERGETETEKGD